MAAKSENEQSIAEVPRRRRKKSMVWEHFTVEAVAGGCARACCKRCKQTFAYSTGTKVLGTSHLKRHLARGTCPKNQLLQEKGQLTPYTLASKTDGSASEQPKKRYRGSASFHQGIVFDQDQSRLDLAKMIIMHEYPIHMVEHSGFVTFVQSLQPQFKMVSCGTVEDDILAIYQKEKQILIQLLGTVSGRVSLTLELWTSSQTLEYICLTGHFIDNDWKIHRRVLNFIVVSSRTGSALADGIATCLMDWNMDKKLCTVTLDNCSLNDDIGLNLKEQLSGKNTVAPNGQFYIASCFAHILNITVQEGLRAIHEIIYVVRESIKYVKASQAHEDKFAEIAEQLQINSTKMLSLDVQTQWNTTYQMLVSALEYKEAFFYLGSCDPNYSQSLSVDEWKKVDALCKYLKVLYDAANVFKGMTNPTSNMYFHEAWKIKLELSHAATSEDVFVSTVIKPMHEKFDKYWKDCSLILAIAVVMDPRFKMKLIEFSFSKIYGETAGDNIKIIDEGIHELYLEYIAQPLPLTPAYEEQGATPNAVEGTLLCSNDGLLDFDVYISETASNQQTKSELDQYLEEAVLPRVYEFDVLNWWRLNKLKYPTLSKMARDVLCIPMSTVTSESIFSTGSCMLDDSHSALRPETVQALICAKDWLQQPEVMPEPSNAIVKVEF
ncbi:hypothetical protein AAC387_Pa03g0544 [Persea americana]